MTDEREERVMPAIVFGAADEPDKVISAFRATPDYGGFGIEISTIGHSSHGYDYGERIKREDIGLPFFALLFRKRGSVQALKSDVFAQVVLTLEDIARMSERGIYELQTWISGLKELPAAAPLPDCFKALQFETVPTEEEVKARYRQLCKSAHPDAGGSESMFQRLTENYEAALVELEKEGRRT